MCAARSADRAAGKDSGETVNTGIFVALALTFAPQAAPVGPSSPPVSQGRRDAMRMMEAVLSRAVLTGAERLAQELGSGNPDVSFFTGQARARGFILDGYGIFFHVEIPEMQQSVVWSVTTVERDMALASTLASLRRALETMPDGTSKLQAEQALKTLQVQVGPVAPLTDAAPAARGFVRSAEGSAAPVAQSSALPPLAPLVLKDPNAAYRDAIKAALVDAMLEYSRGMDIQPDEWLSVAAHRGDSPLAATEIVTTPTVVLRIKGSDLALYDADRARKDEIRQRVEAREF